MNERAIIAYLKALHPEGVDTAVVLGSGLGGFTGCMEGVVLIAVAAIPGYPQSAVAGHEGALYFGRIAGKRILAWNGRLHLYEGHSFLAAALPATVSKALGARLLIATNAAGGINPEYKPGDFMLIQDYIVAFAAEAGFCAGLAKSEDGRPLRRSAADIRACAALHESAAVQGTHLLEGTYGYALGPSYETRTEIRMLRTFGADAVGMSTVPELLSAGALGIPWAAVSCITNTLHCQPAGHAHMRLPLKHEDVTRVAAENGPRLAALIEQAIKGI